MSTRRAHQQARRQVRVNKRYTRSLVAREPRRSAHMDEMERMAATDSGSSEWRESATSLLNTLNAVTWKTPRTVTKAFTRRKT